MTQSTPSGADAAPGPDAPAVLGPQALLAAALVDELVRCGATDACLAPGSRSTPLVLALHAHPDVRLHVRVDERSAAFCGVGLGRASGRPALVVTTSGTAAVNLHPAVVEAHHSRVPLILLTADRPPELRDTGANQTIEQRWLYGTATRWFADLGVADAAPASAPYWRSVACRAWAEAVGSPAGPVQLNLPFREPLTPAGPPTAAGQAADGRAPASVDGRAPASVDGRPDGRPWTQWLRGQATPTGDQLEAVSNLIADHTDGLVVIGDIALADPRPLLELAETAGWPVVAEPQSGARQGPLAVSAAAALSAAADFAAAHRPTAALRVGKLGLSRHVLALLGADVEQVLIDSDGAWLDPTRSIGRIIAAEPDILAREVLGRTPRRTTSGWLDRWLTAEGAARGAIDGLLDAATTPTEARVARDLAGWLPDGSLLVVASSLPVRHLDLVMRPRSGLRVVGNRGASGIDGFTSTAVGAALAHPGPTVALAGDLSVLHDAAGLVIADGEPRPDLTVVVLNNDGGGIFSLLAQERVEGFERLFGTPHGADFAELAAATGWEHRLLQRPDGLDEALTATREAGGLQLIEVRTSRAVTVDLHRRLLQAVADAVA